MTAEEGYNLYYTIINEAFRQKQSGEYMSQCQHILQLIINTSTESI